jgi:two-component system cell cycle sensor histidine kinase/response regulator CckA
VLGPQVDVSFSAGQNVSLCAVDHVRFEQMLLNLLLNARDAMPSGGNIRIRTELTRDDSGQEHVLISVADTGVGIPPEALSHIFEPFFTTKERGKGTGLGLASVYGIVRAAGGEITVESDPKSGTVFRISLPAIPGVARDDAPNTGANVRSPLVRVLVVDDEESLRVSIADWLASKGNIVSNAASGEDALDLLSREALPDVILTDMLMPGINGLELARTVRREYPEIKTIIMTGYADLSSHEQEGFEWLQKPTQLSAVAEAIGRVMSSRPT